MLRRPQGASAGPELGEGAVSVTLDEASSCQAADSAPAFLGAKLGPGSTPEGDTGEAAGPYRGEPAALEPPKGTSGMELPGLPEVPSRRGSAETTLGVPTPPPPSPPGPAGRPSTLTSPRPSERNRPPSFPAHRGMRPESPATAHRLAGWLGFLSGGSW